METLSANEALQYIEQNASKHDLSCLDIGTSGFRLDSGEKKITDISFIRGRVVISNINLCKYGNNRCFKFTGIGTPACMKDVAKYISVQIWGCGTFYYFYLTKENLDALMEYVRISLTYNTK